MSRKAKREEDAPLETVEPVLPLDPDFPYKVIAFDAGFFGATFDLGPQSEDQS